MKWSTVNGDRTMWPALYNRQISGVSTTGGRGGLTNCDLRREIQCKFRCTSLNRYGLQAIGRLNGTGLFTVDSDGSIVGPAWNTDIVSERFVGRNRRGERVAERIDGVNGHFDLVVCII